MAGFFNHYRMAALHRQTGLYQQELLSMVNEPFGFETESADEFKKAAERWLNDSGYPSVRNPSFT